MNIFLYTLRRTGTSVHDFVDYKIFFFITKFVCAHTKKLHFPIHNGIRVHIFGVKKVEMHIYLCVCSM